MNTSGINMENVKDHNRALILQLISTNNGVTKHFLQEKSHLTPMTISNITAELVKSNIVTEVPCKNEGKTPGRIPKVLLLSSNSPVVAGIYLSRDSLYGVLTDLSLNIIEIKTIKLSKSETKESLQTRLINMSDFLTSCSERPLLGLGVAVVGVVDSVNGRISHVMDFYDDIEEMEIQSLLQPRLEVPVSVKNDMQSAALCEMYFGLGKIKDDFIYIGLTNGVGSSIVANNQLLNSSNDFCGEFGHMTINYRSRETCKCGSRGCLELYASTPKIIDRINKASKKNFTDFQEAVSFSMQDKKAYSALEDVSEALAFALNNLINLFDISTIIFGHSGYYLPETILESIATRINQISLLRHNQVVQICKSSFNDKSPILGAACIVLDQLFNGSLSLDDVSPAKNAQNLKEEDF